MIEGELLANELNIPYIETSALNGSNVDNAFVTMTSNIKKSVDKRGLNGIKNKNLKQQGNIQLATGDKKMSLFQRCGCS